MKYNIMICCDEFVDNVDIKTSNKVEIFYFLDKEVDITPLKNMMQISTKGDVTQGILEVDLLGHLHIPNTKTVLLYVDLPESVYNCMCDELFDWRDISLNVTVNNEDVDWFIGCYCKDMDKVIPYLG